MGICRSPTSAVPNWSNLTVDARKLELRAFSGGDLSHAKPERVRQKTIGQNRRARRKEALFEMSESDSERTSDVDILRTAFATPLAPGPSSCLIF